MHQTGGGDQLVGRIAPEVQSLNGPADLERQRPNVYSGKRPDQVWVVKVDLDPA
jgi:hypothetical protein